MLSDERRDHFYKLFLGSIKKVYRGRHVGLIGKVGGAKVRPIEFGHERTSKNAVKTQIWSLSYFKKLTK